MNTFTQLKVAPNLKFTLGPICSLSSPLHMYTQIHTYIRIYIYIHMCIHTYIHTYVHTHMHTIHSYTFACTSENVTEELSILSC